MLSSFFKASTPLQRIGIILIILSAGAFCFVIYAFSSDYSWLEPCLIAPEGFSNLHPIELQKLKNSGIDIGVTKPCLDGTLLYEAFYGFFHHKISLIVGGVLLLGVLLRFSIPYKLYRWVMKGHISDNSKISASTPLQRIGSMALILSISLFLFCIGFAGIEYFGLQYAGHENCEDLYDKHNNHESTDQKIVKLSPEVERRLVPVPCRVGTRFEVVKDKLGSVPTMALLIGIVGIIVRFSVLYKFYRWVMNGDWGYKVQEELPIKKREIVSDVQAIKSNDAEIITQDAQQIPKWIVFFRNIILVCLIGLGLLGFQSTLFLSFGTNNNALFNLIFVATYGWIMHKALCNAFTVGQKFIKRLINTSKWLSLAIFAGNMLPVPIALIINPTHFLGVLDITPYKVIVLVAGFILVIPFLASILCGIASLCFLIHRRLV
ncbi:MAG: hypothetical protein EBR02_07695 [Alphaproteobacteria bacterium]|nr:hypothetical protein [Alphaproteobacteria bacterium]